jgi:prephenate dehydrogenase
MKKLAIIGLGLMGGSLGLAAKRRRLAAQVHGYARRRANRRQAVVRRAVDKAWARPEDAVRDADVVVLCLPVLEIPGFVWKCRRFLKRGCVVTDVGSTKAEVVRECRYILAGTGAVFVGGHPIAGSEQSGIAAAKADLYRGAVTVVTPVKSMAEKKAAAVVETLWKSVGARVIRMSPAEHDRLIARTSHLPHLVAAMLVELLGRSPERAEVLCGPGFRDATRMAAGSEDIWHDIVKTNRASVGQALDALARVLAHVRKMVRHGDFEGLRGFLATSREKRKGLGFRLSRNSLSS